MPLRFLWLFALLLAACGSEAPPSAPAAPLESAGGEALEPPAVPSGPPASYVGSEHRVVVRVRMDAVRASGVSADIASLVRSYPTWRELLGSSGIDPVRDFDAVLVASPAVISDSALLVIRHRLGNARIRDAVLRMAVERGERPTWRQVDGFSVVDWPAETSVPRLVVLTGENELVVTTPEELDHVIAVARDHAARREGDACVEPALAIEDGIVATITAEEVGASGRRMRYPPESFHVAVRQNDEGGIALDVSGTYADEAAADRARRHYGQLRDRYAGQMLVRAVGLDRPLRQATIAGEGNTFTLGASFTEEELRRILGMVALGQIGMLGGASAE